MLVTAVISHPHVYYQAVDSACPNGVLGSISIDNPVIEDVLYVSAIIVGGRFVYTLPVAGTAGRIED